MENAMQQHKISQNSLLCNASFDVEGSTPARIEAPPYIFHSVHYSSISIMQANKCTQMYYCYSNITKPLTSTCFGPHSPIIRDYNKLHQMVAHWCTCSIQPFFDILEAVNLICLLGNRFIELLYSQNTWQSVVFRTPMWIYWLKLHK